VLFGYRLRVFGQAARTSVSEACRVFGNRRSTSYVWKRRVERHGLEIRAAGRAGRDRLLLRRPPRRHKGIGLAAERD